MKPFLSLQEIHLSLPDRETPILENVSIDVYPGDFLVLLGSNGSGKSSLLKAINGLTTPTSGAIFLDGVEITEQSIHKRAQSIVTLTQDLNFSTFSKLTVLENCLIALHRNRRTSLAISVKKKEEEISRYLSIYSAKLVEALHKPTASLSGGERQTLALAMSLYTTPSLLLLDEHTSALDPAMAAKLMGLTSKIAQGQAIPTIMATHNLDHACCHGNRLIIMRQGRIVQDFKGEDKNALTRNDLLAFYGH